MRLRLLPCLLCLCAAFCLSAPAAPAAETAFPPELLESLRSRKVADRQFAIEELAKDPSEAASTLLRALLEGVLYLDRETGAPLIFPGDGQSAFSVMEGKNLPLPDPDAVRKVGTSNKQREAISTLLNSRSLRHPDPALRRAAAAVLLGDPAPDRQSILSLLESEKDEETREYLEQALALLRARDSQSGPEELLAAMDILRDCPAHPAQKALEELEKSENPAVAQRAGKLLNARRISTDRVALAETFFFGLSLGSVLVLTSIGLAVTFGVMGVINMAHGELVMLGAYTVWGMQQILPGQAGAALLLSIPAAFLVSGGVGMALERGIIRHLYGRPQETLLATFGISLILQQAVRTLISPMNRAVESPEWMSGMWRITRNFSLTCNRIHILFFCLGVFLLIYLAMRRTRLGLEVRAVTQNRAIARALGIDSAKVDTLTFALGSGVAGMAGVALSQIANVGPNLGQSYIVDSFMVVVFGGVGNLWGTLCGGLLLGLVNKILEPASGAIVAKIIILGTLILFMQARPKGLFPERGRAVEQ